jgi:hypothetical protein
MVGIRLTSEMRNERSNVSRLQIYNTKKRPFGQSMIFRSMKRSKCEKRKISIQQIDFIQKLSTIYTTYQ